MPKLKNKNIDFMSNVAKDIIQFNTKRKDLTYAQALKKFYSIMRKHGIKQATPNFKGNGQILNNFEWTMCITLFHDVHYSHHQLARLWQTPPKDLQCYTKSMYFKI